MAKKKGPNFSPEFRLETAQLVVDQGYSQKDAADAMGVGYSTIGKGAPKLREELQGKNGYPAVLSNPRVLILIMPTTNIKAPHKAGLCCLNLAEREGFEPSTVTKSS